jgi:hypothetical protein
MATVVKRTLNVNEDNAKELCWADTLQLEDGSYAFVLYLDGSTDGWAHLNDTAKAELYPTETARPFKLDSYIVGSRSAGTMYVTLEFNGTTVHEAKITSITKQERSQLDITHDLISNSTRATDIAWHVDGSSTVSAFRVDSATIDMYFYQYEVHGLKANKAKGVKDIHISNNNPYHGDTVTVTVDLHEGAKWYGWYADPAHTQLLSTEKDMVFESSADVTAYAYATLGTGFRFKKNGQWINSIGIYRKENGTWVEIDKSEVDITSSRYVLQNDSLYN